MNGVDSGDKSVSTKPSRAAKMPGGAELGKDRSVAAKRLAAAILEVLAGARTPAQAAEALSLSVPRYYQVETPQGELAMFTRRLDLGGLLREVETEKDAPKVGEGPQDL